MVWLKFKSNSKWFSNCFWIGFEIKKRKEKKKRERKGNPHLSLEIRLEGLLLLFPQPSRAPIPPLLSRPRPKLPRTRPRLSPNSVPSPISPPPWPSERPSWPAVHAHLPLSHRWRPGPPSLSLTLGTHQAAPVFFLTVTKRDSSPNATDPQPR